MMHFAVRLMRRNSHVNWGLSDQALVSGSNFLANIILARLLGASGFGEYTLIWMVVLFVQSIQHAAINLPMMTIGPKQGEKEQSAYFGAVFIQQMLFAFLSTVFTYFFVRYGSGLLPGDGVSALALPLAVAVLASQLQDFLRRFYFSIQKQFYSFLGDFVRYVGQLVVFIWIFYDSNLDIGLSGVLWIISAASFLSVFLTVAPIINQDIFMPTREIWTKVLKRNWKFSKWLILSALMQWTSGQVFFIVAGALIGTAAVGAMRAAQSFVGIFHILFMGLENVLPSRLSSLARERGERSVYRTLNMSAWLLFSVTFLCFFVIIKYGGVIMDVLYGSEYMEYSFILVLFSLGYVFSSLAVIFKMALRYMEITFPVFLSMLIATLWSVASSWWLGSHYGVVGIMYGLVFYFAIQAVIPFLAVAVLRRIFWPINLVGK